MSSVPLAIIDYGVGNLRSVEKAFEATACEAVVSSDERVLRDAERLVLPGVGAFQACMKALKEHGFAPLVMERVREGTPLLGVCVGMQMLFEESEEFGRSEGLGFLRGRVRRFSDELLVPQVGWNQVYKRRSHPLFANIEDGAFFYFVHSYYCDADTSVVVGETEYGARYASVVAEGNVCGVQFHPEKSQAAGLQLLKNFASGSVPPAVAGGSSSPKHPPATAGGTDKTDTLNSDQL
ncbi:MAG: imidazole glycerol phosphate synthase subunit HisH [Acidobacteria bacterium]|nr:MAG: imidazole glycerol phosphate synthase subunit HisH [Acidobacteriota bacterium]